MAPSSDAVEIALMVTRSRSGSTSTEEVGWCILTPGVTAPRSSQEFRSKRRWTMKTALLAPAIILLLATNAWAATTVKSSKSNSQDRRFVRNVTSTTGLSGPSNTQTVYTTGSGTFILTEVCVSPIVTGGVRLDAVGFGSLAHVGVLGDGCRSFANGILLPPNSTITCSTLAGASPGSYFCTIAGLEE
jgi:hypothetical protein